MTFIKRLQVLMIQIKNKKELSEKIQGKKIFVVIIEFL